MNLSFSDEYDVVKHYPTVFKLNLEYMEYVLMFYRTIDSLAVAYGKGRLPCFVGDPDSVVDVVSY